MGVFLYSPDDIEKKKGLPHARGGVSRGAYHPVFNPESSPRPWGCFRDKARSSRQHVVFPTPVGVFLHIKLIPLYTSSLPHARGGVSRGYRTGCRDKESSPRPWGCFRKEQPVWRISYVFPTPVGVFLRPVLQRISVLGLPHARGGVSLKVLRGTAQPWSSPRPWGCF